MTRYLRLVRLGVKTLMLHKLRSMLTMLGVVFGVGSVIAMLAVGEGASQEAMDQIRALGSQNIIINAQKPQAQQSSDRIRMAMYGPTYRDEQQIRETLLAVSRTVPAKLIPRDAYFRDRAMEVRVVGTTADWFDLVQRPVIGGRVLHHNDIDQHAGVVVLTERVARRLLATEQPLGESVRIGGNYYRVVGVIESDMSDVGTTGGVQTPDTDVDAYIPITTARQHYGEIITRRVAGSTDRERVELHQIIVEVSDLSQVEPTAAAIRTIFQQNHEREDYRINVPLALLRQAEETQRTFNIVLGSIAGISLLVGGIGIMNIMLASVTERTREIGVRRAIGARRRQIVSQFLIETIVLSGIGGLVGILLGVTIPAIIERFADMPTVVPLYAIVLSLGISVAVGVIFGLYPAIRAARLDPIVALRYE